MANNLLAGIGSNLIQLPDAFRVLTLCNLNGTLVIGHRTEIPTQGITSSIESHTGQDTISSVFGNAFRS